MTTSTSGVRRFRTTAFIGALASLTILTAACTGTSDAVGTTAASDAPGTSQADGSSAQETGSSSPGAGPGSSTASVPNVSAADVPAVDPPGAAESSPSEQAPPPATTPVAPPTAGDINQTVAAVEPTTLAPASFQQAAIVDPQVTATVDSVQQVDATGRGVGEISGPALAYSVTVTNTGSGVIDLGGVSVNVQDQAGAPFSSIEGDPAKPLTGPLAPGQSAQGVYVFTLPADFSGPTTLSLAYAAGAPIALFTGVAS